jgi:regulatory protein
MSVVITKIEQQKKSKSRYSLFSGEKFIIGISEETLIAFNLYDGIRLSDSDLDDIISQEKMVSVREQAWRFLARREHSQNELRSKLLRKSLDSDIVEQIISDLIRKDYINDERFARLLIIDEVVLKSNGPLLIKNKLRSKGVQQEIFEPLIKELYPEEKQLDNCKKLGEKKHQTLKKLDPPEQKKRLIRFLAQRGYTWDIIEKLRFIQQV